MDIKDTAEALEQLISVVHQQNKDAGWWDLLYDNKHSEEITTNVLATKLALVHSEVSEMLEGLRKGTEDDHLPGRSAEEVEAADILIRLFDYCGYRGLDVVGALFEKLAYNARRSDHKRENRFKPGGKTV